MLDRTHLPIPSCQTPSKESDYPSTKVSMNHKHVDDADHSFI